jgi:hypothetical protein
MFAARMASCSHILRVKGTVPFTAAIALAIVVVACAGAHLGAQTQPPPAPRPFPQPSPPRPNAPAPPTKPGSPATAPAGPQAEGTVPDERTLGVPIYPTAQYLTSYDAGRGQRFYLFGVAVPFAEMVAYYRNTLKARGEVLFETPPTHQFEIGRFREETMAFPPSVTVKDFTWGGSAGYPNPKRGAKPERFQTIIQIVPVPPGSSQ